MDRPENTEGRDRAEMRPLMEHLDEVGERLDRAARWTLLLDFDGTLAPIVERPEMAKIPESTLATLTKLARRSDGMVGLISGRGLDDVRGLVRLDSLYYAGNHGLEIRGPGGMAFDEPTASGLRHHLAERNAMMEADLADLPGAEVEAKGLTTSVHYRRVDPSHWQALQDRIVARIPPDDQEFAIHHGKKVLEIRPRVSWGKGHAASWLLETLDRTGTLPIFLGDDTTDEDVFRVLGDEGVTARVEPFERSLATYRVANTGEVARFLEWMAARPEG